MKNAKRGNMNLIYKQTRKMQKRKYLLSEAEAGN